MPTLDINEITELLKKNALPVDYQLKTPMLIISTQLPVILSQFQDNAQMMLFISKLSSNKEITINNLHEGVQQGERVNFLRAYAPYAKALPITKQEAILNQFKACHFNKSELLYLFKNLEYTNIRDLLFTSDCFSKTDLLEICNNPSELKDLEDIKTKLFYFYLNTKREKTATLSPILDMYYLTFRAGHTLGLSKEIYMNIDSYEYKFNPKGGMDDISLTLLLNLVKQYIQAFPSSLFNQIYSALQHCHIFMNQYSRTYIKDAYLSFLTQYRNNKLVYLSTGWPGHCVSIVIYGDYLVYCNRGEGGDRKSGCKIFKIKNENLVENLLKQLTNPIAGMREFHNILNSAVYLNNPLFCFRSKSQKRGTCSFVNPKSSIEAMIVLLQAGPFATPEDLLHIAYLENNRKKYKTFSEFMRNKEIDNIVFNMFYAQDPHLMRFYANLVKTIITEHQGTSRNDIKNRHEIKRMFDLYERTPDQIKRKINEDVTFMKLLDSLKIKHEPVLARTVTYFPWFHIQYVRDRKRISHAVSIDNKGYIIGIDQEPTPKTSFTFKNARRLIESF